MPPLLQPHHHHQQQQPFQPPQRSPSEHQHNVAASQPAGGSSSDIEGRRDLHRLEQLRDCLLMLQPNAGKVVASGQLNADGPSTTPIAEALDWADHYCKCGVYRNTQPIFRYIQIQPNVLLVGKVFGIILSINSKQLLCTRMQTFTQWKYSWQYVVWYGI